MMIKFWLLMWGCLGVSFVFGQNYKLEIVKVTPKKNERHVNVSANSVHDIIVAFKIYPSFIKGLEFDAKQTGVKKFMADSAQSEYRLILPHNIGNQTITIKGFKIDERVEIMCSDSILYHEYQIDWTNNLDMEMQRKLQSTMLEIVRDSILKVYRDSLFKVFPKPQRRLIKDWSEDFKMMIGISNGIIAGEFMGAYGELKFGRKTGFALEAGYGLGLDKGYDVRWSGGIKGYYKYWFLSAHYGTTTIVANKNSSFQINDDGSYFLKGRRSAYRRGVSVLLGYDRNWRWFHLTTGIGTTVAITSKPRFLPAWNIGVGISMTDLVK